MSAMPGLKEKVFFNIVFCNPVDIIVNIKPAFIFAISGDVYSLVLALAVSDTVCVLLREKGFYRSGIALSITFRQDISDISKVPELYNMKQFMDDRIKIVCNTSGYSFVLVK